MLPSSPAATSFDERCYALLKQIPRGKVTTYKALAKALNSKAWRAVGSAMARNPQLLTIPCHRVVRSNGQVGDYAGGTAQKASLLSEEGVSIKNAKVVNMQDAFFDFSAD